MFMLFYMRYFNHSQMCSFKQIMFHINYSLAIERIYCVCQFNYWKNIQKTNERNNNKREPKYHGVITVNDF